MNEPLYQIAQRYEEAYLALADLDLPEEAITDTLEAIEGEIEEKAINVAKFIGNMDSQANQIDDAIKAMTVRKKALAVKSANLKDYLKYNMEKSGITNINCPFFDIKIRKNPPSVNITDEDSIPDEFKKEKVTITIDKTAIKKAGGCDGAEILQATRVDIK